ncbi:hypothetical protein [Streptomyces halobius]|uniref:Uncharacterized protein n=1 Tax=Streptomyces halobius TaxID=2879846 RepID=A0ABY4MKM5_9ACTN|nr:hypothetical protein [Streptomyces halobius]UQA96886.1 hypothetical protein K9S39_37935 [Streptomyces halobius]
MTTHRIPLQDYDRHDLVWALDPPSGHLSTGSGRCHGFVRVSSAKKPVAALFADAGRLWLQYGDRHWDCEEVSVRHSTAPDGTREFTVTGPRGTELCLGYPAPRPEPFDPAYDWIDTLADDFLLWVAERLAAPDRREALREHYTAGFTAA